MVRSFIFLPHRSFPSLLRFQFRGDLARHLGSALLLGSLFALTACDSGERSALPPTDLSTVRIVSSLPVRGVDGAQAHQIRQTIDLAIAQRSGRAGSWTVEHLALDDGDLESGDWTAKQERDNAQRAADDPTVVAYIGPYNSGALGVALPVTNRAHLLEVSPSATWPGLTTDGWNPGEPSVYYPVSPRNLARIIPSDAVEGLAAAQWAHDDGVESVLVLDDGSSYSKGLGAAFTTRAKALGISLKDQQTVAPAGTDITALMREQKPDAIFYAPSSASNAARVAIALSSSESAVPVYASDTALSDQFIEQARQAAAGWHVVDNSGTVQDSSPDWRAFSEAFVSKYGKTPSPFAAAAYDSTNLVLDAIAQFGKDRRKVLNAVLGKSGYKGAFGEITFNPSGDNTNWMLTGWRYGDGRFERVRTISGRR